MLHFEINRNSFTYLEISILSIFHEASLALSQFIRHINYSQETRATGEIECELETYPE